MNEAHRQFLASPEWARMLETDLLPWITRIGDIGDDVLEVGPGPGLTTDVLRTLAALVTAVEIDEDMASALAERLKGSNVTVINADATGVRLPSDRFSAAASFSMLHHVPTPDKQDEVFAEVCRLLRPGGVFIASDSRDLDPIRAFHADDVFVPLDPLTLPDRLGRAGFADVDVEVGGYELRFHARKPASR